MSKRTPTFDVFLSYSRADLRLAEKVHLSLTRAGLSVFNVSRLERGADLQKILWEALAESAALVAVLRSSERLGSSVAIELGAAMAWHKPIYIIRTEKRALSGLRYLSGLRIYPITNIDEVATAIQRGIKPLTEEERAGLCQAYVRLGIPTDRLLREPSSIDKLAHEFKRRHRREIPGERLVRELIRLRKTGKLPRLSRS